MNPGSGWCAEIDRVNRDDWSRTIDQFDDVSVYQTWSYGGIRWGEKNLSHLVLKRDNEVLGAAQLRIVRPTRFKFGIAYLRWGPLFERRGKPVDCEATHCMARFLEQEYVEKRKLFLRVLPNAFGGTQRAAAIEAAFGRFTREPIDSENIYRTFLLDLSPSIEDLRKKLDKKWRNQLSAAERNNLQIVRGQVGSGDLYQTFCLMYDQMQQRKTFETTVDVHEFGRIQQDLPESQRMQVLICQDQGRPVAGFVGSAMGDTGIYLLGATSDAGLKSKGGYLLQWTFIQWLKENGFKWYDLGGIDPEKNPGVYHFKRGLSGSDVTQISPMFASRSVLSSTIAKAALAMRHTVRMCKGVYHFARPASPQTSRA